MSHPLPPKKEVALALLERSSVHVHLDPRAPGVVVPPWLKRQPQLVLQVGLNMPVPIPDLRLDEAGMTCTLSFNRSPFHCVIPWSGVFAMVGDDGRGMIWKEDVPPEVAKPSQARPERAGSAPAEIGERALRIAPEPPKEDAAAAPAGGTKARAKKATAKSAKATKPATAKERAGEPHGGLVAVPARKEKARAASDAGDEKNERPARAAKKKDKATPAPTGPTVPTAAARGETAPAPAPRRMPSTANKPVTPSTPAGTSASPTTGTTTNTGTGRPKRELPPYLRVVK